jgi:hypothetical protein
VTRNVTVADAPRASGPNGALAGSTVQPDGALSAASPLAGSAP